MNIKLYCVFALVLLAVLYPRFNREDKGEISNFSKKSHYEFIDSNTKEKISSIAPDIVNYLYMVQYFRGETIRYALEPPYIYRWATPFFASFLPFKPMTAINVINIIGLLIGLWALSQLLSDMHLSPYVQAVGLGLYTVNFPVLYYGSIGFVDSSLQGLLMLGVYAISRRKFALFSITLLIGFLSKETMIFIVPVAILYIYSTKNSKSDYWWIILWISIVCTLWLMVRYNNPFLQSSNYIWQPESFRLSGNLSRYRGWIAVLLSCGIVIPLAFAGIRSLRHIASADGLFLKSLILGVWGGIILTIYAFFAAYLDGRHLWIAYPFAIPLACFYLQNKRSLKWKAPCFLVFS